MSRKVRVYEKNNLSKFLDVYKIDAKELCKPNGSYTQHKDGSPTISKALTTISGNGLDFKDYTIPQLLRFIKDAEIAVPGDSRNELIHQLINAGYQPELLSDMEDEKVGDQVAEPEGSEGEEVATENDETEKEEFPHPKVDEDEEEEE